MPLAVRFANCPFTTSRARPMLAASPDMTSCLTFVLHGPNGWLMNLSDRSMVHVTGLSKTAFWGAVSAALLVASLALVAAVSAGAAGSPGAGAAARLADNFCSNLQQKHAAAISNKFGRLSSCERTVEPIVQSAIQTCVGGGQPGSAAFKSCVLSNLQSSLKSALGGGSGGAGAAATKFADNFCSNLQQKAGERFSNRFASLSDCEGVIEPIVQNAIAGRAGSGQPGSADFKSCVLSAFKSGLKQQG